MMEDHLEKKISKQGSVLAEDFANVCGGFWVRIPGLTS